MTNYNINQLDNQIAETIGGVERFISGVNSPSVEFTEFVNGELKTIYRLHLDLITRLHGVKSLSANCGQPE